MKLKLTLMAAAMALVAAGAAAQSEKPFTVPEVSTWKAGKGTFVPSTASTRIVTDGKDAEAARIAWLLGQDYTTMTGTDLPVEDGVKKARRGDIALKVKPDKKANPESYTIDITPTGATLTAPTPQGLYWATRTLLQLTELADDGISLPVGKIQDSPAFGLRGFHMDAGRKYIPLEYLYKLVDIMSYYKMNTLNLHLNDNGFPQFYDGDWMKTQAAFRLESDAFPGLTARDGSYTKKEFRDFVKYAAKKGVNVIPEIDVPAHSLAFTQYMPELGSHKDNGFDHLDIDNPKTYEFLDKLIAEYLEGEDPVFAGPVFNIGTDEYKGDSLTMEKFRAFTDRYIKYVEGFGKRPAVWGSLSYAKGQTPVQSEGVLMLDWNNGYAQPRDMIADGFNIVNINDGSVYIVPAAGYYYDYLNNPWLYDSWTPAKVGDQAFEGEDLKHIEGGMFAVWNDHPNNGITVKDIHHRVMHSLPVMAAKTWSSAATTVPYETFAAKAAGLSEAPGVNYLARYGKPGETMEVLTLDVVPAGSKLPIEEIGYDYTVEFDLTGAAEAKGTKLFESPYATFWLSDPISGDLAFSREGHLIPFRYNVEPGKTVHVKVTGNNKSTQLYVDGKLIDDLGIRTVSYDRGKNNMHLVRTLVFPLSQAGNYNSKITNLRVVNAIAD